MLQNKTLDENYSISKSTKLLHMKDNPFSLGTMKLLDTFLSKINPLDNSSRTVSFTKPEYEKLLGVSKIKISALKEYTDQLRTSDVVLQEKDGFYAINLFESCRVYKNNGVNIIEFTCSQTAKELFFNLENVRYIKYQLKNTINLKNYYSPILYFYLLENEFRVKWTIELSELRKVLFIENNQYTIYKHFNDKVLKKAVEEINAITNIKVIYSSIRVGKSVEKIEFIITKPSYEDWKNTSFDTTNDKAIKEVIELYTLIFPDLETPVIDEEIKSLIKNSNVDFYALFTSAKTLYKKYKPEMSETISLKWILQNSSLVISKKISLLRKAK